MVDIDSLIVDYKSGSITGKDLKDLETNGKITKSERRKIIRNSKSNNNENKITDNDVDPLEETNVIDKNINKEKVKNVSNTKESTDKNKHKPGRNSTCLLCRNIGHLAKNCRLNSSQINLNLCFNCGSNDHILKECKEPKSSKLEYAICFICKKEGHIAKDCVDNPNGLYPNGGSCHVCQLKTHFSKDCPNKKQMKDNSKRQGITPKLVTPIDPNANDDAVFDVPLYEHELEEVTNTPKKRKFNEKNKYYAKPNKK